MVSLSFADFTVCATKATRAVMARKPRWQDTAFSWRWVPLWVYYNFVIKISRKKHTQAPSSLPSGREESLSGEKNLSETEQGQWEKYMSGRGRRRRRRRRRGEQIKSCQMEILGFKRSETGVKGLPLFSRLYVMLIGINIYGSTWLSPLAFAANSSWRFQISPWTTLRLANLTARAGRGLRLKTRRSRLESYPIGEKPVLSAEYKPFCLGQKWRCWGVFFF